ncbi:MAG: hypothetical protein MSG77_07685 [Prevotella sp.]|nr:hypothetical protein [Prevotella sp.]
MEIKKQEPHKPNIGRLVRHIETSGYFNTYRRYAYTNYDISHALKVIEAIGKSRNRKFVIDEENRFAYENFIKWCHGDTTMQALDPLTGNMKKGNIKSGIYIAGNTGSGKSWCLEIMLAYVQALNFQIKFTDERTPSPLYWYIVRADDICEQFARSGDISNYKKRLIIGIQDFGQEPKETLYMGNRLNVLQQLVEYRGDRADEITLITSNLRISSETLKGRYGDRVQSRLAEMCNYFEIKGRDRRIL